MCFRSPSSALAAAVLFAYSASAGQVGAVSSPLPLPVRAPGSRSLSVSAVQFSNLWKAAQYEVSQTQCSSQACFDSVAAIQGLEASFAAGTDPAALLVQLKSDISTLNAALARDLGPSFSDGMARGEAMFHSFRAKIPHSTAITPDVGTYDQCTSDCQIAFAVALATCPFYGPAAPGCVAGAVIGLSACYFYCAQTSPPGGGGNCYNGDCDPDDPGSGVLPASFSTAAAKRQLRALSLRLDVSGISSAMALFDQMAASQ